MRNCLILQRIEKRVLYYKNVSIGLLMIVHVFDTILLIIVETVITYITGTETVFFGSRSKVSKPSKS